MMRSGVTHDPSRNGCMSPVSVSGWVTWGHLIKATAWASPERRQQSLCSPFLTPCLLNSCLYLETKRILVVSALIRDRYPPQNFEALASLVEGCRHKMSSANEKPLLSGTSNLDRGRGHEGEGG